VSSATPTSVSEVISGLGANGYLSDEGLATAIFLSLTMGRPLLLEGEPGVGKTEVAKALSALTGGELLRLQCYEGLDASQALYEWDYPRQLLHLRAAEAAGTISSDVAVVENELYSERFLVRRPLLDAISDRHDIAPVLLIDELDRADDEFEAFLLEVLADNAVTIPELGTFRATVPPIVKLST
jgi:MoxR-like ATPase